MKNKIIKYLAIFTLTISLSITGFKTIISAQNVNFSDFNEEEELSRIDTNGNGRVTIAEAEAAGYSMPIYSTHWLYKYMHDADGDGMVGEGSDDGAGSKQTSPPTTTTTKAPTTTTTTKAPTTTTTTKAPTTSTTTKAPTTTTTKATTTTATTKTTTSMKATETTTVQSTTEQVISTTEAVTTSSESTIASTTETPLVTTDENSESTTLEESVSTSTEEDIDLSNLAEEIIDTEDESEADEDGSPAGVLGGVATIGVVSSLAIRRRNRRKNGFRNNRRR